MGFTIDGFLGVVATNNDIIFDIPLSVFIDDNLENCLGAMKLGIKAILLCRDKKYFAVQKILSIGKGYKVIHSLNELL